MSAIKKIYDEAFETFFEEHGYYPNKQELEIYVDDILGLDNLKKEEQ